MYDLPVVGCYRQYSNSRSVAHRQSQRRNVSGLFNDAIDLFADETNARFSVRRSRTGYRAQNVELIISRQYPLPDTRSV
ncbi:hypothetical protein KCP74_17925 [Salmonella enterica subsp. enterica]|nr:hypothetical protein KCP74_17925 [Salmonella enterica subsp. enterica]